MRVSMKVEYGVRALIDLAHYYGEGPISNQVIATRHSIPLPFLDQVMATLRRAGIVRSIRGPFGGHALIRDPADVSLIEAVHALEGSLAPIGCLDNRSSCPLGTDCTLMPVWQRIEDATTAILSGISILDLAQSEKESTAAHYAI
jgi:Rrf2 family protein